MRDARTGRRRVTDIVARGGALALIAGLVVGCGNESAPAGKAGVPILFRPAASGATPFGDVPWPSDLYLTDGHIGEIPGLERVAAQPQSIQDGLSALDGFGRSTGALFFVDEDVSIDAATLPRTLEEANRPDAAAYFVDVDTKSKTRGKRYPALAKALPTLRGISVIPVPGIVLPQGVRHAAVLTKGVRTTDGRALAASKELEAIETTTLQERKTDAEKLYGAAFDELVAGGADVTQVAGLAVMTTSRRAEELPALRARLRELPEPAIVLDPAAAAPYSVAIFGVGTTPSLDDWLGSPEKDDMGVEWPGGDNPGGIAHDAIGAVASGAFVAPSLLDPATHHFERGADGEYVIADDQALIPVTVVLPKAPPPPEGYPVVINGHGLSNNRGSMLSLANELCRKGFAMIGIDDVEHGARAGIADVKNNYKGPYQGPDGIPDDLPLAVSFFAGFTDFVAVRDNFRQTVLDQTSLVRLVQSSKLDLSALAEAAGGTTPVLDGGHIYWSGGSLGGIMGTMTIAVEPEIRGAALQVPGASFVQLITTSSATVSPLVSTIATGNFGIQGDEVLDEFHPVALLLGAVTEAGDPIAYAPSVLRAPIGRTVCPDLLVTYALDDEVLPNISTHALLRAFDIALATPHLVPVDGLRETAAPASLNDDGCTAAAVQYAPANHGLGYDRWAKRDYMPGVPVDGDPRFPKLPAAFQIEMPIREHSKQLAGFFSSAYAGKAVIDVTAPAVADFDDDGKPDDKDADPIDPTVQ